MTRHERDPGVTVRGELLYFKRRTEDGWGVGRVELSDGERVDFTGKVLDTLPGDAIELTGTWVEHPRFGRQFKVRQCVSAAPVSLDGVTRWLAGTLPGIGETRAKALVEHFGGVDALWRIIEDSPGRLSEINGITGVMAQSIHVEYMRNRSSRDCMVTLRGWGLTDAQIQRCVDEWATIEHVVEEVRCNPYQLSRFVHGFGFKRADEVAARAGIRGNDPRRIEAGIEYVLDDATGKGHCWLWGGALQKLTVELLHVTADEVADAIFAACRAGTVRRRGKRVYSARMDTAEERLQRALTGRLRDASAGAAPSLTTLH
jgi:exodeoxyribonuclease V alpha subunit